MSQAKPPIVQQRLHQAEHLGTSHLGEERNEGIALGLQSPNTPAAASFHDSGVASSDNQSVHEKTKGHYNTGQPYLPVNSVSNDSTKPQTTSTLKQTTKRFLKAARPTRRTLKHVLEAVGLTIVYNLIAQLCKWEMHEEKKVAIDQKRRLAAIRCLIHLIPIAACVVLLFLNGINYYIGAELAGASGKDQQKFIGLQLAAKLHELFMLASLAAVLVTHIRREMALDGVPYGTVFSVQQFHDISILWSLEFWGAMIKRWENRGKKWPIITLITVCAILGLLVGPSSAYLMRPREDYWRAGGTPFWLSVPEEVLYPKVITDSPSLSHCMAMTDDPSCPAGGWQILADNMISFWPQMYDTQVFPERVDMAGENSVRSLFTYTRYSDSTLLYRHALTQAMVPFSIVSDSLAELARLWTLAVANSPFGHRLRFRDDEAVKVTSLQPKVVTLCTTQPLASNGTNQYSFPNLGSVSSIAGPHGGTLDPIILNGTTMFTNPSNNLTSAMRSVNEPGSQPSLFWIDDPDLLNSTQASLAAVAIIPGLSYYACSVDSRFTNVSISTARSPPKIVVWGETNVAGNNLAFYPNDIRVRIDPAWAKYLNPPLQTANMTVFSSMIQTSALWNSSALVFVDYQTMIVEQVLSLLLANGIGRLNYNATMLKYLKGLDGDVQEVIGNSDTWAEGILPKDGRVGPRGGSRNAFSVPEDIQRNATQLQMEVSVHGWAYTTVGLAPKLAMAILAAYILVASCHIAVTIATGRSSTSWGSPAEVASLAMRSQPTDDLRNTGAGIATLDVFSKPTKVEVKNGELQITFSDKENNSQWTKIQPNTAYG